MDSLESELEYFTLNQIEYKLSFDYKTIDLKIRKCLLLRVNLADNCSNSTPKSAILYSFDTHGIKETRQQAIEQFLTKTNNEIKLIIENKNLKIKLSDIYLKVKNLIEEDQFLKESFEVLEQKTKNQIFKFENACSSALINDMNIDDINRKKLKESKKANKNKNDTEDESKNQKFKGSDLIFERIKWDKNIDKDQVIIGYLDRFIGIKDIKFNDFKGVHEDREGVPLHRIRYFKINDKLIWDRDKRIDFITGSGDVSKFFVKKQLESEPIDLIEESKENFTQKLIDGSILKFTSIEWEDIVNLLNQKPNFINEFCILTYNIMSKNNFKKSIISKMNFKKSLPEVMNRNEYDKDELGLKDLDKIDRMHKILELFENNKPDFVLLQECEQYEETILKQNKFIQKNYYFCTLNRNNPNQLHSNCVLLTKLKPKFFKTLQLTENSNKSAQICKFEIRNDSLRKIEQILIVNFHLTSNKSNDFLLKRKTQLETLKQYLIDQANEYDFEADYTFLCGDFNFGDNSVEENNLVRDLFLNNGFKDLVKNSLTFDPTTNFSASITAFKSEPRRLDRILFKSSKNKLTLTSSFMVNTAPFKIHLDLDNPIIYEPYLNIKGFINSNDMSLIENNSTLIELVQYNKSEFYLHPSDHYGLQVNFKFKKSLHESNLVHKSTLAIVFPKDVSEDFIQKVRNEFDPQINRWPPHINILYPFYNDIDLDLDHDEEASVIGDLFNLFTNYEPFDCDLTTINYFKNNNVVYLEPSKNAQNILSSIYISLKELFEDIKNFKWNRSSLTSHLTIAQPVNKSKADKNWALNVYDKVKAQYNDFIKNNNPLIKFKVDCVHWMTRTDTTPFMIKYSFPLGFRYPLTITGLNPISFKTESLLKFLLEKKAIQTEEEDKMAVKIYEEITDKILKSNLNQLKKKIIPIGSYLLGVKCNDLDLCLCTNKITDENSIALNLAYDLSQYSNFFHIVRNIDDAIVPIIELCLNSNHVSGADLQIYEILDEINEFKSDLFYDNFKFMSDLSHSFKDYNKLFSISGLFENQNIKKYIRYYKDFQVVISFVKYWAKRRQIYGKAFGYLSGISWSILVIYFLQKKFDQFIHRLSLDNSDLRFKKLIKEFFKFYSEFNWSKAICLLDLNYVNEILNKYQNRTPIMIMQSVYPYKNTTSNVNEKVKKILISELNRAKSIMNDSEDYESVCEKPNLSIKNICFKILFNNLNDLNHIFTIFKAKIHGLITNLQKIDHKIEFRPISEFVEEEFLFNLEYKFSRVFYINIFDLVVDFNQREKEIILNNCNVFINAVKSLKHCNNFEILIETNF